MSKQYRIDELIHHGVKGQKWGVRRYQNKDGSLTPAGKLRYRDEECEDGSYVLRKGSEVHRVTANPDKEKTGHAYISFMDADVKGYKHEITNWLNKGADEHIKTFDLTMKLTKDLVLPSEIEKAKTYVELLSDQKVDFKPMLRLQAAYSDMDGKLVGRPKRVIDGLVKQGMDQEVALQYTLFAMSMFNSENNRKAFVDVLKSKGYNAIEDLEDSYSHRMKPIIVFERENALKVVKCEELPNPEVDPEKWEKIVDDATESISKTDEYHKKKGIK